MKKKIINQPIVNIALEYANKTFTKEFLDTCTDSWYFDALDWFEYTYKTNKKQRDEFSGIIQYQFNRYYTKEYGKRDDYYHLKGITREMENLASQLNEILKRGTLQTHNITFKDSIKKLNGMQFSLNLAISSINRKYNFEKKIIIKK